LSNESENYAGRLILQLETRGDVLSKEAADFIRAERTRVTDYQRIIDAMQREQKRAA
jgi:hypothetical protein